MSKYLINERPLTVLPTLAKMVGIEKAIILQQIHYALNQPKSGKTLDDGEKYIWNTYQEWHDEYFSFWSPSAIQKHFLALEKEGFLISRQPNKTHWDRTKHYRINYTKLQGIYDDADVALSKAENVRDDDADVALSDDADVAPSYKEAKSSTKSSTNIERENARAREINPNFSGIPVIDYSGEAEDKKLYYEEIVDGLRERLGTPCILPDEWKWVSAIKFAYENKFASQKFLDTFDLLERLKKANQRTWKITAQMIENNIGSFDNLVLEVSAAENKEEKQNGQHQQYSKQNPAGREKRPTNYEISRSRDYSEFEGFDPIAVFAE